MRALAICLALALAPALAAAQAPDRAELEALREGDMRKLVFHAEPQPVSDSPFEDLDGGTLRLSDFAGQVVVLNFWATWCAPCRKEMPALDRLQASLGSEAFRVVTVATGRNSPAAMRRFFEETGVENLPLFNDPDQRLAREMAVLGLPITVILNRQGKEIARLRGDAHWDSDSAKAILSRLIDAS